MIFFFKLNVDLFQFESRNNKIIYKFIFISILNKMIFVFYFLNKIYLFDQNKSQIDFKNFLKIDFKKRYEITLTINIVR